MCELAIRYMPLAASISLIPSGLAIFSRTASNVFALFSFIWPPRKYLALR